jgi:filamentous hemagglutinin family protein
METLSFSGLRLNPCAAAIATAFALQPFGAAGQQIVPDGHTATSISVQGPVTDVTTASVIGPNAFNSFQRFDVWSGNTVNLHVPQAASNLINLVHGETTRIDGILNAVQGGTIGGNVFFLNPHGIIVGREGVINAGALTLITPTKGFTDSFFDANGLPNGAATAQVLAGQVPINANGLVWVQGRINASTDVRVQAGNVINAGAILPVRCMNTRRSTSATW